MEQKKEVKKHINSLLILLVIVVIVGGVFFYWYWMMSKNRVPETIDTSKEVERVLLKEDSVSKIGEELNKIETLDLETEFKEIDQDLNSL